MLDHQYKSGPYGTCKICAQEKKDHETKEETSVSKPTLEKWDVNDVNAALVEEKVNWIKQRERLNKQIQKLTADLHATAQLNTHLYEGLLIVEQHCRNTNNLTGIKFANEGIAIRGVIQSLILMYRENKK